MRGRIFFYTGRNLTAQANDESHGPSKQDKPNEKPTLESDKKDISGRITVNNCNVKCERIKVLKILFSKHSERIGVTVSGDGTWRKRGFSSLFGVATVIGNLTGKVIDIVVKSAYCKVCEVWEKKIGTNEYEEWLDQHVTECKANHEGSAGKMEVSAIVEIFQRSQKLYNTKYVNYIGDGDSKTFNAVVNANPYDIPVNKKECVGHVQKRMGTALRKIKQNTKGLGGKGKLTAKLIDELSSYYGNAIRGARHSTEAMRNAILATYYHKCSTDESPQHNYCPVGETSWCSWQRATAKSILHEYRHKTPLQKDVQVAIYPVYEHLSDETLLARCVGGYTQNSNESLNAKIWKIAPKIYFSGAETVEIAAYIALATYNDGNKALLSIMRELELAVGSKARSMCEKLDQRRLSAADVRARTATKEARKETRRKKKEQEEEDFAVEGALYGPGIA
ncbi:uncharacterized protein LOC143187664 [Calliopsis andreniformis]|uniref:uncharacterized protein LOC143187664 n=1 Tax=Calliopsis andreniformis TaxID=337506 RepID=UPI003FCDA1C4